MAVSDRLSRTAGYFSCSIHAVHGRAVPVAEGIKLHRPELNVIS